MRPTRQFNEFRETSPFMPRQPNAEFEIVPCRRSVVSLRSQKFPPKSVNVNWELEIVPPLIADVPVKGPHVAPATSACPVGRFIVTVPVTSFPV